MHVCMHVSATQNGSHGDAVSIRSLWMIAVYVCQHCSSTVERSAPFPRVWNKFKGQVNGFVCMVFQVLSSSSLVHRISRWLLNYYG